MAWSYKDFENSFLDFVKNRASDPAIEQQERESLEELVSHIRALSGSDVCDARVGIAASLKATVCELTNPTCAVGGVFL
jgi:hypothetical protein